MMTFQALDSGLSDPPVGEYIHTHTHLQIGTIQWVSVLIGAWLQLSTKAGFVSCCDRGGWSMFFIDNNVCCNGVIHGGFDTTAAVIVMLQCSIMIPFWENQINFMHNTGLLFLKSQSLIKLIQTLWCQVIMVRMCPGHFQMCCCWYYKLCIVRLSPVEWMKFRPIIYVRLVIQVTPSSVWCTTAFLFFF